MSGDHRFEATSPSRATLDVGGGATGLTLSTSATPDGPQHYGHALALGGAPQVTAFTDVDEPWQVRWSEPLSDHQAPEDWAGSPARAALLEWCEASGVELSEQALALLGALPPDQYTLIRITRPMTHPAIVFEQGAPTERGPDSALVAAVVEAGEEQDLLVTVEATVRPGTGFNQLLLGLAVMDYPYDQPERAHLLLLGLGARSSVPLAVIPRSGPLVVPCSTSAAERSGLGRSAASVGEDWLVRKHAGVIEALARG